MTVAFPSCASFQQSLDNVWFEIANVSHEGLGPGKQRSKSLRTGSKVEMEAMKKQRGRRWGICMAT